MLRRIIRSLPRSSQTSYKYSPVLHQRTIVAPLSPSLVICLGVSVATFATIATIHGDATPQEPADQIVQVELDNTALTRVPLDNFLVLHEKPPSPTTDEMFDLSSESQVLAEEALGINRIDTILLGRYVHEQCAISNSYRSYFSPIATSHAKTHTTTSQSSSQTHSATLCLEFTMDITEIS